MSHENPGACDGDCMWKTYLVNRWYCIHYHCSIEEAKKNFPDGICPNREVQDEDDEEQGRSLFGFGKDW